MNVLRPHFAGSWYPDTEAECLRTFKQYEASAVDYRGEAPLNGGLVPHAGWHFSGRLAYNVVRELARSRGGELDTVVLFGGHLGPSSGAAVLASGEAWTPLGNLTVDEELAAALLQALPDLRPRSPADLPRDNTLELQLPLLHHLLPGASLLAMTPPASGWSLDLAGQLLGAARGLGRTLGVIGSTDLTHYGPNYSWAPKGSGPQALDWVRKENDRRLIERAVALDSGGLMEEALARRNACCPGAAAAALECGRLLGSPEGHLLTYATSSEIMASDSFVGYAAIVF